MAFRPTRSGAILAFVLLLFFASGFAALLYQTIWQRMLGFFSGVDVYSVTITVAAFMGGLGCGSLAGGHLADRLSPKRRLLAFGLAEGIIALFALGSKWLYYDLLYLKWSALAHSSVFLPVILFVSLLIPTFCMGMTLPILAKAFTPKIEAASAVVGYLLLGDSRIKWEFTDGRAYILRSGRQFDVIEADALRPNSAYSGNLYSSEYFQMLKAHLKPDGLAVTWAPTDRVLASFLVVFPHAILVDGIAIGSQQPVEAEPAEILARMTDPFTSEYYRRVEGDLRPLLANLLAGQFKRYSPETDRPALRDLNSDLFPKDEYMIPPQP